MFLIGTLNHRIRKNKVAHVPREIIFVDTEAYVHEVTPEVKKFDFRVGVACYCRRRSRRLIWNEEWLTFHNISDFWNWAISKIRQKGKLVIIAHNLHFDFVCLNGFEELANRGFKNIFHVIDSEIFIAKFKSKGKSILVLDLFNWFKFSVETMGEYLEKPKMEIDFENTSLPYLIRYCQRDVEIIKGMFIEWLKFIKFNDLGRFMYSTAGQAYTAFKHRFMKHDIYVHKEPKITEIERKAYMGGRTEAFVLGLVNQEVFALDFNSLYPSVMINNNFPISFLKHSKSGSLQWLKMILEEHSVIANCYIETSKPVAPKKDKRLIFPVGSFWSYLCTPEIKYLLEHNSIKAVKDICIYKQAPIFSNYVKSLYELRESFKRNNNIIYDLLTKLLLNSLYGKFGQLQQETEAIGECDINDIWVKHIVKYETGERIKEYAFGGVIWTQKATKKEWKHSFPAICGHVTSFARIKLLEAIELAKWHNTYYCDTDSVFVNKSGYENLIPIVDEHKLGALKLQKEADTLLINGLKDYEFGEEIKRKGIKENAIQLSKNKFKQERWLKFKSLLKMGSLDTPIVKIIPVTLKREYKKGIVQENGFILPLELSELLQ